MSLKFRMLNYKQPNVQVNSVSLELQIERRLNLLSSFWPIVEGG